MPKRTAGALLIECLTHSCRALEDENNQIKNQKNCSHNNHDMQVYRFRTQCFQNSEFSTQNTESCILSFFPQKLFREANELLRS